MICPVCQKVGSQGLRLCQSCGFRLESAVAKPVTSYQNHQWILDLNLDKSEKPLQDFLRELGNQPYRDFVEYRMKGWSSKVLQDLAISEFHKAENALGSLAGKDLGTAVADSDLRESSKPLARLSATLRARILKDPSFWTGPTERHCRQALVDILSILDDEWEHHHHPAHETSTISDRCCSPEIDNPAIGDEVLDTLTEFQQKSLFALLMFATDLFAAHAAESKLIRQNMGIS